MRVYTELAWHNLFARHLFITPERPVADFVPEFTVVDAALFQADPQRDGTAFGDLHSRQLRAPHDSHRRYALRRRDQEVGVHGNELLVAAARDAADALLGQRRARGRRRDLLRPLGHRQDDALLRFAPSADRRRRARLVGRRRLQLRRRMLREGDSPLADGGARDLGRDQSLLDRHRERRIRRADARNSTSTRTQRPRTRARPIRSSSFPTSFRQPGGTSQRRSSC